MCGARRRVASRSANETATFIVRANRTLMMAAAWPCCSGRSSGPRAISLRPSGSGSFCCSIRSTRALGEDSLLADRRRPATGGPINLIAERLSVRRSVEFWNYWAGAKWHYTVPIMEHTKIFEMPVPGYFGFPAFALECFTMYVFVRAIARRIVPIWPSSSATPSR